VKLRGNRDLAIVALLAGAGMLAAFIPLPNPLRSILAAPLVLALPGYALSVGLFPARSFPLSERAFLAFALSIAACVLPGLVVQVFFDFSLHSWGISLAIVTWAAVVWAARRRWEAEPGEWVAPPAARDPADAPGPRIALAIALIAASVAVAGIAVAVSSDGVHDEERRQQFASLWAVPDGEGPDDGITIGVWNHYEPDATFRVTVERDGRVLREFDLTLDATDRWLWRLPGEVTAGDGRLVVTLTGQEGPERRVALRDPVE
jgi:uncharacterized membrane protein